MLCTTTGLSLERCLTWQLMCDNSMADAHSHTPEQLTLGRNMTRGHPRALVHRGKKMTGVPQIPLPRSLKNPSTATGIDAPVTLCAFVNLISSKPAFGQLAEVSGRVARQLAASAGPPVE